MGYKDEFRSDFQAKITRVDNAKKIILLSSPKIKESSFINREVIRYKIDTAESLTLIFEDKTITLPLIELSENSLKVTLDNNVILKVLRETRGSISAVMQLSTEKISLKCKFLKEGKRYDKKVEILFTISLEKHSKETLMKWLNSKQLKVIQEIREYSRAL